MVKNLKTVPNVVFDSSNYAFWDTDCNTKNGSPLHSTVVEKIRKNCVKIVKNAFLAKNSQFPAVFLHFFKNGALLRVAVFCVAFSVP